MECQIGNSMIIIINREVNSGGKKLEVMVVIKLWKRLRLLNEKA